VERGDGDDLRICDTTRALLCYSFGRTSSSSPVVCVFCAALLLPLPFDVFFEGFFFTLLVTISVIFWFLVAVAVIAFPLTMAFEKIKVENPIVEMDGTFISPPFLCCPAIVLVLEST
jgi:hypothetical protein